ncbi:MAG: sigma-70 family RNA polymerase sigma factor [Bacteroidota bacterium]
MNSKHFIIEHFFRHEYGNLTALLSRKFGIAHLELIEDSIMEAMFKAMKVWSFSKIPDNPQAWFYKVAHNKIIDQLRRDQKSTTQIMSSTEELQMPDDDEIQDEWLKLIFACCHPMLKDQEQLMLSLKLVCGLNAKEISIALQKSEAATKRALTRAKANFKEKLKGREIPEIKDSHQSLQSVLKVIYLLFNEGYKATSDKLLIKKEICEEALRLAFILEENNFAALFEIRSLIALMCFKASRFDARLNEQGGAITLEEQDRSKWNKTLIQTGYDYLLQASNEESICDYFLEAAIESHYAVSQSFAEINWKDILVIYDYLLKIKCSQIVKLNRLIALEKVFGAKAALLELEALEATYDLEDNYLFHLIKSDMLQKIDKKALSVLHLKKAIKLSSNAIERNFLEKKLESLSKKDINAPSRTSS